METNLEPTSIWPISDAELITGDFLLVMPLEFIALKSFNL